MTLFMVLVAVVGIGAYMMALLVQDTTSMATFAAGLASLAGVLAEAMRRTWRDWSKTELILALVEDASEQQVRSIIEKLVEKI